MNVPRPGLAGSLRSFAATAVALLQTRLELLATEVQEEKLRLGAMLLWGIVAIVALLAGLVFLAVLVTVLLWDSHRLLALGIFSALFLGLGIAAAVFALRERGRGSTLFATSLAELSRDRDALEDQ
jgi:uncharacterized membrane protein YqjE